ncbi:HAD-IA family hydrolase [Conyzicola sp.]|uniref:HAD-IA family hydrolase n=1 Tax=Conyzicola sp. TaxID=1969404 RepID=UPI003988C248
MDLYLFDFDKTLYAYDFRKRLPELARLGGVSQYHLASTWWAAGYERRAESGEWPTSGEYLAEFARVTGAELTLDQWADARGLAMTRIDGSVAALRRAATLGTTSLLSNNPSVFQAALPLIAPDVASVLGDNLLVSAELGVRKPDDDIYYLAMRRYGARPENTFFVDDSAENVDAAAELGVYTHHFTTPERLDDAITAFSNRVLSVNRPA